MGAYKRICDISKRRAQQGEKWSTILQEHYTHKGESKSKKKGGMERGYTTMSI
jgi:hypothetical protein